MSIFNHKLDGYKTSDSEVEIEVKTMSEPLKISPAAREAARVIQTWSESGSMVGTRDDAIELQAQFIQVYAINTTKAELEKERDSLAKQLLSARKVLEKIVYAHSNDFLPMFEEALTEAKQELK